MKYDTEALLRRARKHCEEGTVIRSLVSHECLESALSAALLIAQAFQNGNKLLICGNGGSAADSQHVAAELVSRLHKDFDRPGLPAIALTTDSSFLTAYANDIGFEGIFARQVQALGKNGDVLLGISTSGTSKNVIMAFQEAKKHGVARILLSGEKGKGADADHIIAVPSGDTQYIQESHLMLEHIMCDLVRLYFSTNRRTSEMNLSMYIINVPLADDFSTIFIV